MWTIKDLEIFTQNPEVVNSVRQCVSVYLCIHGQDGCPLLSLFPRRILGEFERFVLFRHGQDGVPPEYDVSGHLKISAQPSR